eukprot:UN33077
MCCEITNVPNCTCAQDQVFYDDGYPACIFDRNYLNGAGMCRLVNGFVVDMLDFSWMYCSFWELMQVDCFDEITTTSVENTSTSTTSTTSTTTEPDTTTSTTTTTAESVNIADNLDNEEKTSTADENESDSSMLIFLIVGSLVMCIFVGFCIYGLINRDAVEEQQEGKENQRPIIIHPQKNEHQVKSN